MQTGDLTSLLEQELTSETLREALAFIDAYELSSSSDEWGPRNSSSGSPSFSSSPEPESPLRVRAAPSSKTRPKDVRKRIRLTTKKELELLRLDVQKLESTLNHLKSGSLRTLGASPAPNATPAAVETQLVAARASKELEAMWIDMAVRQSRRRQKSEATNRQLKRSLAKQLKIAKYLEALLARRTIAEEQEASNYPCMKDFRHLQCSSRDDELVFTNLVTLSEELYAAKDVHIEQAGLLFANSLVAHTKRTEDPKLGSVFETVSSTPVPFPVQQTDVAIWNGLFKGEFKNRPVLGQIQNRIITEEGLQKNFLMTLEQDKRKYDLHSRTALRKFKESTRIIYTWTTVTVLASKGIRFSSQSMMILEPSLTLPMNATVLKKWHRYHVDHVDHTMVSTEEAEPLINGFMKTQTGSTLSMWAWLENHLLGDCNDIRPPCART